MISDEAVEAAAKVAWNRNHDMPWSAAAAGWHQPYLREAREALEAAAPYLVAQALEAAADQIIVPGASSVAASWLRGKAGQAPNPYRSQA